jgi:hypothetical protein
MIAHQVCNVIVQDLRQVQRSFRLCPIAEHDWHRGKHLHVHAALIAIVNARVRIPTVVLDLAKRFLADHHPRAAGIDFLEANPRPIAKFLAEVGPARRQDMGV